MAAGETRESILMAYPYFQSADIEAAYRGGTARASYDRDGRLGLPATFGSRERDGAELILFRGGSWNEADVRLRMATVLAYLETSDIIGSVIVVERKRVRRRRLPL